MRLRALDQISVSAVKADVLRPGEAFDIGDDAGAELLARHPAVFQRIDGVKADRANQAPGAKMDPAPLNKMEPAPLNKSRRRAKAD